MDNKNKTRSIATFAIAIAALVIIYLFALNGRYTNAGDRIIYDKWKKEAHYIWGGHRYGEIHIIKMEKNDKNH